MPLFDLIFDLNPYFGYSATFAYFSLSICHAARCVNFTVALGRRGAFFFLWEQDVYIWQHIHEKD